MEGIMKKAIEKDEGQETIGQSILREELEIPLKVGT